MRNAPLLLVNYPTNGMSRQASFTDGKYTEHSNKRTLPFRIPLPMNTTGINRQHLKVIFASHSTTCSLQQQSEWIILIYQR